MPRSGSAALRFLLAVTAKLNTCSSIHGSSGAKSCSTRLSVVRFFWGCLRRFVTEAPVQFLFEFSQQRRTPDQIYSTNAKPFRG